MGKSVDWIRPAKLLKGDTVGVAAPAGPVDPDQLEKGLQVIRNMGFNPRLGESVLRRHRYLGGTDSERAADLIAMIESPDIKAILCARGGYGVNRILANLDPRKIRRHPKIFVGSSDITLLHLFLNQRCSLVSFHGPMVAGSFGRSPMKESQKQFRDLLMGKKTGTKVKASKAKVIKPGSATGKVTGGCLTLLCRSLKTRYEIQTKDKLLLIEDVNEPLYRLDGMLWQLKSAGKFKDVRGIILGEMIKCQPRNKALGTLEDMYHDLFADLEVPILMNCPIGHGKEMWTVPLGMESTLDTKKKTLDFQGCGVE